MRLTAKLGLASALSITTAAGAYGVERLYREVALFESDMRRDHHTFGRAAALAAQAVQRMHGRDEAKLVIAAMNEMEARVLIELVEEPPPRAPEFTVSLSMLLRNRDLPDVVSIVPTDLGSPAYLRIEESRRSEAEYVSETLRRFATFVAFLVTLTLAVIFSIGWWFLGHPLQQLVAKVRRVGAGDLGAPLLLRQRDEMGVLAREINAMCEKLLATQADATAQADARVRAVEQLRHADRLGTVGKLSAGLAHELGTPLNVVSARAKMIMSGESEANEITDDARVIFEQSERMTRIIRQLLDFARRGGAERRTEELRTIVSTTLDVLEPLTARTDVAVVLVPGPEVLVEVDAKQIQQVITNLVMNAHQAQAGRGGEIRVEISDAAPKGRLDDARTQFACLSVTDSGVGMSPDVLEHAFEPFFTTKDVGQGTGLGLSVAHGIVEEHGGVIAIESESGKGTVVRVYLPKGAKHE